MGEVEKFYDGKCLFVTGVTGFVGKFLLEKILRSCNPSCVYVLIRKKRGLSSEQRLKQFLEQEPVFHFKSLDAAAVNKVIPVDGNIEQEDIFCNKEDLHQILSKVNIVIHSAATVRFTEKFEDAFKANSAGTGNILNLCRCISKLSAFVYVSTYATQVHRDRISEEIHPMVPGLEEVIRRKGITDLTSIRDFCRPHADSAPNSYTFTKNIAEVMVKVVSEQEGFRAVVLRPPVVCAPSREPEPGFADDPRQGLVSFALSLYLGVIVMFVYDGSRRFIYNTVDVIVNAILVSAFDICRNEPEGTHFRVLNACRSGETTNQLIERIIKSGQKYPSMKQLRPITVFQCTRTNGLMTRIKKLFYHYMFAVFVDISLLLTGNKMLMYSSICKLERLQGAGKKILFFTDCQVEEKQFQEMQSRLSPEDRDGSFFLEPAEEGLSQEYMDRCCLSLRKYVLKEGEETLHRARIRMQRRSIVMQVAKLGFLLLLVYLVIVHLTAS